MTDKVEIVRKTFVDKKTDKEIRYYSFSMIINGQRIALKPADECRRLANYVLDEVYKD